MRMFDQDGNLDADIQDALYEVGNVGLGMASITIGQILGMRVLLASPLVVPLESSRIEKYVTDVVSPKGHTKFGFFMEFQDKMQGMLLLIIDRDFILKVIEKMTGRVFEGDDILDDEVNFSAISEFANMIAGAYMKAIGSYTGIRIYLSPVMANIGEGMNLLKDALERLSCVCDMAICVKTDFVLSGEDGGKVGNSGQVILMPGQDSVEKLMEALGM